MLLELGHQGRISWPRGEAHKRFLSHPFHRVKWVSGGVFTHTHIYVYTHDMTYDVYTCESHLNPPVDTNALGLYKPYNNHKYIHNYIHTYYTSLSLSLFLIYFYTRLYQCMVSWLGQAVGCWMSRLHRHVRTTHGVEVTSGGIKFGAGLSNLLPEKPRCPQGKPVLNTHPLGPC